MGITFNGVHSSVFGLGAKVNRPLLPGNNDNYIDIPGRAGSILYPGKPKDRPTPVEFGFMPGSRELFRSKVWEISSWLNTEERKILIIDDEPGKYYIGKVENQVDLEQAFLLGKFSLTFRCEPFAYGAEVASNFAEDAISIDYPGTYATAPIFEAEFTAATDTWRATKGTDYIRIDHDFQVGDRLLVNLQSGLIAINGSRAMNKLDWQNSHFFNLLSGTNYLSITPTGVCSTTIKYTPVWL